MSTQHLADGLPEIVGVLGGGRMGAGIAHAFLMNGAKVIVVERDEQAAQGARDRVAAAIAKSVERGAGDIDPEELLASLSTSIDYADFTACGLVVEAVPEDPGLKISALASVEAELSPTALLATNTSSLSVTELAEKLDRPENFIGLHFFNPVPASTLIEIVVAKQTAAATTEASRGWVSGLGKTAVVVNDSPGFASSRLGNVLGLEAMRMLEEGVATAEDIDTAIVLGYKHPIGPLKTSDIVGLDVRLGVSEYLHATLGERFAPPQILRDMVARGELGRKTGKGFYNWS